MSNQKETYEWYKSHGICVRCRTQDADLGHVRCTQCRMRDREEQREYYRRNREKKLARNRNRRETLKAAGTCIFCGKREAKAGHTMCEYCLAKSRRSGERFRRDQGVMPRYMFGDGEHCTRCGKSVNGEKLCPTCLEKARISAKKARESKAARDWREHVKRSNHAGI